MLRIQTFMAVLVIFVLVFIQDNVSQQVTGNENHFVTLTEASQMTKNFRDKAEQGDIIGGYFGKKAIFDILNQQDCVGLRYYYGINTQGNPVLVLVGVDQNGNDLYDGLLAELSQPCPPFCGEPNPLTQ